MNDAVLLIGASEVELMPRAVVAPLTPNKKVGLEEVDVEVLDTDETVELDDELVLVAAVGVVEVGVAVVLVLVVLAELEVELLGVVSAELVVEAELVVVVVDGVVLEFEPELLSTK